MPKLYEYFGIVVLFYSNEHEPIHVHGKASGRECRAELQILQGRVVEIQFVRTGGRPMLNPGEMRYFEELVRAKADEIVRKWIDYFVWHKPIEPEVISRRTR